MEMLIKINEIKNPVLFIKPGAVLIYDTDNEKIYSRNRKQSMPSSLFEKLELSYDVLKLREKEVA